MAAGMDKGTLTCPLDGTTLVYQPYTIIAFDLHITNPTTATRTYRLSSAKYDPVTGGLILGSETALLVSGSEEFTVDAGTPLDVTILGYVDATDVLVGISLYDVAEAGVDDSITVALVSVSVGETTDTFASMMPMLMIVMMMGMMVAMITPTTKSIR